MTASTRLTIIAVATCALLIVSAASSAQVPVITAGANMNIDFNQEVDVPYNVFTGEYSLEANLIHSPPAGPMFKKFPSPMTDTGGGILLDALQPFPQRVTENFDIIPTLAPIITAPVGDWHEEIVTPGWEWVLPGDARFPTLFPAGQSLITKNGNPHPWEFIPMPAPTPHKLWVRFPMIGEGNVLDIHKALLWVGTTGNRIWGDNLLDDGSPFDESLIRVWEYPTVPEPSSCLLLMLGTVMVVTKRTT